MGASRGSFVSARARLERIRVAVFDEPTVARREVDTLTSSGVVPPTVGFAHPCARERAHRPRQRTRLDVGKGGPRWRVLAALPACVLAPLRRATAQRISEDRRAA